MFEILRVLSDEKKLRIVLLLREKPLCVCEIGQILDIKQSTLSTTLSKIKNAGLITDIKNGKWSYYNINKKIPPEYLNILNSILDIFKNSPTAQKDLEHLSAINQNCRPEPLSILLVCEKNACRSQLSEAILRKHKNLNVFSCGTKPSNIINKKIENFLKAIFPNEHFFPKHIDNFQNKKFDIGIFLCREAYKDAFDMVNARKKVFIDVKNIDRDDVSYEEIRQIYNELENKLSKEIGK